MADDQESERNPILRDLIGAFDVGLEGSPLEENHIILLMDEGLNPFERVLSVDGISYRVSVEALS